MTHSSPFEKTPSRTTRVALFGATGLMLISLLAGCSSAPSAGESPSPHATATASGSDGSSGKDSGANAADALKLTGPAEARDIPDMKPVLSGVKPALPTTVTDAHGKEITVTSAKKVLALDLNGTLTDTMVGLGLHDRLIGRSNSDTSALLKDLPVVTKDGHDTNVEAILNLKPDLIITTENIGGAESYRQLENAGITVVRLEPATSIEGIPDGIRAVGKVFGVPEAAEKLAKETKKNLEEAAEYIKELRSKTPRAPRAAVLYVRGTGECSSSSATNTALPTSLRRSACKIRHGKTTSKA
ncbi:ABC transporter substrate-binding protein [Pseudoglutamicibacter albus]|uniref:ABC transporter substrate-binding protein n=1 Tax=Pseudoglutamicibacter albus TaxID=98671 RepID=UPI00360B0B00